jgi:hypothetical protein
MHRHPFRFVSILTILIMISTAMCIIAQAAPVNPP